jgi:hypothetical protein
VAGAEHAGNRAPRAAIAPGGPAAGRLLAKAVALQGPQPVVLDSDQELVRDIHDFLLVIGGAALRRALSLWRRTAIAHIDTREELFDG